jgi:hypothetical protein
VYLYAPKAKMVASRLPFLAQPPKSCCENVLAATLSQAVVSSRVGQAVEIALEHFLKERFRWLGAQKEGHG